MPSAKELIAHGRTEEEICQEIGADWLIYQDLEDLKSAVRALNPAISFFETSCFDGCYVTGDVTEDYLARLEGRRNGSLASDPPPATRQLDLNLAATS